MKELHTKFGNKAQSNKITVVFAAVNLCKTCALQKLQQEEEAAKKKAEEEKSTASEGQKHVQWEQVITSPHKTRILDKF